MTPRRRRVLVLGATGGVGSLVAARLDDQGSVEAVRTTREARQAEAWRSEGKPSVVIDLDDPRGFPAALAGIDHLFVMTGYTMNMVTQVKTVTDAAADAGVRFIVHLGVLGDGRSTAPHYAWHELVERYVAASGIAFCHLHSNFFMENVISFSMFADDTLTWPMGDRAVGFVAGDDLAAVAAKVLAEGAEVHAGRTYELSADVVDGPRLAAILSRALGREVGARVITPDELKQALDDGGARLPAGIDAPFVASMLELERQVADGRLAYAATRTDAVETLLGRPPIGFERWARDHEGQLSGAGQR